jgi:hypothetical protein
MSIDKVLIQHKRIYCRGLVAFFRQFQYTNLNSEFTLVTLLELANFRAYIYLYITCMRSQNKKNW